MRLIRYWQLGLEAIAPDTPLHAPTLWRWLGLSLMVPIYFGGVTLHYAVSHDYLIQDDARLHLVWMQQWLHPDWFPNDPIAAYYAAIQPVGFRAFYAACARMGISSLVVAKCLPLVLALVTTGYLFRIALLLLPVPLCGVLTTLMLNQNIWLKDDLVSATPRAFVYPLLAAFLYYLLRRATVPCLVAIALQGLIYPQVVLVELAVLTLRLMTWHKGIPTLSRDRHTYLLWGISFGLVVAMVLVFSTDVTEQVGSLVTVEQMRAMPEFGLGGRREYFGVGALQFWFAGASGLRLPLFPPVMGVGLALPVLLRYRPGVIQQIRPDVAVLAQVVLGSVGLWAAAHLLFPGLYLPSRYTFYSLRMVMAIATGIVLTGGLDWGHRWFLDPEHGGHVATLKTKIQIRLASLLAIAIVAVPALPVLFLDGHGWVIGQYPGLYAFLAQQPPTVRIGSLVPEGNNLPAFAQRSVLVSAELAMPYHPQFYDAMLERMVDSLEIQYSPDPTIVRGLIQKHGVDFWLLDHEFKTADSLLQQTWLIHSSVGESAVRYATALEAGTTPAIAPDVKFCQVFSEKNLMLLDAHCMAKVTSD